MNDPGDVLDVEYRQWVRSLHHDAVAATVTALGWMPGSDSSGYMPLVHSEMAGREPEAADVDAAREWAEEWTRSVRDRVQGLKIGHPDPDVSDAAHFVLIRTGAVMFVLGPALRGSPTRAAKHAEVTRQVFVPDPDGGVQPEPLRASLTRLGVVVRRAPFRVRRPATVVTDRVPSIDPETHPTFSIWLEHAHRAEREFARSVEASPADGR